MALATQCPHCHTTFRVAADQLKLRGGIVRCGACQRIFDGNAHLVDLDKPATPPSAPVTGDGDALPVYTLDFDHTFDPLGILPKVATPDEVDSPAADASTPPAAPARAHVWRTGGASARAHEAEAAQPAAPAPADEPPAPHVEGAAADAAAADAAAVDTAAADTAMADAAPSGTEVADAEVADAEVADAEVADTEVADAAAADAEQPGAAPTGVISEAPPPAAAYAPAGRVEPRLDPVFDTQSGAGADAAPEASALPSAAEQHTETTAAAHADGDSERAPASACAPADRIEPDFGQPAIEQIVVPPPPDDEPAPEPPRAPEPEPSPDPAPASRPAAPPAMPSAPASSGDVPPAFLPLRASAASEPAAPAPAMIPPVKPARSKAARASEARMRRSRLTPTKIEPPKLRIATDADANEPEFVKRSRRQERLGRLRPRLMAAGSVVLLLVLAAQVVLDFRNVLAAQHPAMKPALRAACVVLGCRVELPSQVENLAIETGELTSLGPDTYALNTLLRNQGNLVLAWPSIELELTDANDKAVLRRVLAPADYLPRGTPAANGFGPHSEQPVTLHFTLAGLQPSGYHTFVFYP